jgi:hypothetical protein
VGDETVERAVKTTTTTTRQMGAVGWASGRRRARTDWVGASMVDALGMWADGTDFVHLAGRGKWELTLS